MFVISAGVGMFLLAKPILALLESYPKVMGFWFIGAVAGGIPAVYEQSQIKYFSWKYILAVITGMVVVGVLSFLENGDFMQGILQGRDSAGILLLTGMIAAVALILPGISVSYLLLIMGLYHDLMRAISKLDMVFLLPMGVGIMLGIILLTKGLQFVMTKYPQISYLTILGFMIGSLAEVFPGLPVGKEWGLCVLAAAVGFYFIFSLSNEDKKENVYYYVMFPPKRRCCDASAETFPQRVLV